MRNETFYSLNEINHSILGLLEKHNRTWFQKRTYSRYDLFVQSEKSLLRALPAEPFILKHTTMAKVQKNYHIVLGEDWHQYSVPYQHIAKQVKVIYDIGENSFNIMGRILEDRTFAPQAYSACIGLLRLSTQYGKKRFEKACQRARPSPRVNYKMINNILLNNLDKQEEDQLALFLPIPDHENVRGPENYH